MLRRHEHSGARGVDYIVTVNGGPSAGGGGWIICSRTYEVDAGVWRRYWVPGTAGRGWEAGAPLPVLARFKPGGEWWIEWMTGPEAGTFIGPFPGKAPAWAALKMLIS